MKNIFQLLEKTKGKRIPFKYKLIYNIPLEENELIYDGSLYLSSYKITTLPDNLTISGDLFLIYSIMEYLPDNLTVNGCLSLYRSNLNKLSNNLKVGHYLDIRCSKVTELPNNLSVGELYLDHTSISELPDDLIVTGNLFCAITPLAEKINNNLSLLKKYSNQVKGKIIY